MTIILPCEGIDTTESGKSLDFDQGAETGYVTDSSINSIKGK